MKLSANPASRFHDGTSSTKETLFRTQSARRTLFALCGRVSLLCNQVFHASTLGDRLDEENVPRLKHGKRRSMSLAAAAHEHGVHVPGIGLIVGWCELYRVSFAEHWVRGAAGEDCGRLLRAFEE
jgi:hypothetical protein